MFSYQKNDNTNDDIHVFVTNLITSKIGKKTMFIFLLLIMVYSIGFSEVNAYPLENYVGSGTCRKCHETQFNEWNQTAHSRAFTDPVFQTQWQAQGSPDVCLPCHTTNFDETGGDYQFENIGCELCHAPRSEYNEDYTPASCDRCHSVTHYPTYTEWLESEHSHAGVGCDSCHDPMTLEILTNDPNTLCKGCHLSQDIEQVAEEHGYEGYDCLDCHMTTSLVDFESGTNGMTGHTFLPAIPSPDCGECHTVSLDAHTVWGATDENCETCHDDVYMTMLHLLNGTDVAMSESSILCEQCHNDVYYEWSLGIHADSHDATLVCIDCHEPMNPYIMMNKTLPPVTPVSVVIEKPEPFISPTYFFIAIIGALGAAIYAFTVRRK
ncbi:hypothetical protein HN807_05365 [Candidatus Bathyarchaeota archaeon]|jgi:hypothetical protein|nr:hypothetical protein [Candidatus Bathyarchaeota archaeon]MBT4319012.1 hypothetical protein [Candidatus Bathyarchaeota archaeon]MBT4423302.1 hypothetical protein [Candidatus Bathyarchaeota archaeon]MBT6604464.1 hypothetical protein [Candidatus Bathyarchaeota archaeon]MBT7185821.1 hypothetical protein [Candidatus Bathyarchaeota archaeon]